MLSYDHKALRYDPNASCLCLQMVSDTNVNLKEFWDSIQHPFLHGVHWEILGQCLSEDIEVACVQDRGCAVEPEIQLATWVTTSAQERTKFLSGESTVLCEAQWEEKHYAHLSTDIIFPKYFWSVIGWICKCRLHRQWGLLAVFTSLSAFLPLCVCWGSEVCITLFLLYSFPWTIFKCADSFFCHLTYATGSFNS